MEGEGRTLPPASLIIRDMDYGVVGHRCPRGYRMPLGSDNVSRLITREF